MFTADQYELLDFGRGRKLERFGPVIVDRPAPAAEGTRIGQPRSWDEAQASFDRERGVWNGDLPADWVVRHGSFALQLRGTEFGQVGLFPEQAENWDWITSRVRAARGERRKMLNLFAYTGGSTLSAAAAGAEVVHIDAAQSAVEWARRNSELSQLGDRPIRWIAEDAARFVARELRRGNQYSAVILDPPTYGHGPSGQAWKLEEQLEPLLVDCAALTRERREFVLLTCHTPGYEGEVLGELLMRTMGAGKMEYGDLALVTAAGRNLPAGSFARWTPM